MSWLPTQPFDPANQLSDGDAAFDAPITAVYGEKDWLSPGIWASGWLQYNTHTLSYSSVIRHGTLGGAGRRPCRPVSRKVQVLGGIHDPPRAYQSRDTYPNDHRESTKECISPQEDAIENVKVTKEVFKRASFALSDAYIPYLPVPLRNSSAR
jgi:hypothetical protein